MDKFIYHMHIRPDLVEDLYEESLTPEYADHVGLNEGVWIKCRATDQQPATVRLAKIWSEVLEAKVSPFYYVQSSGKRVLEHKDYQCGCSINILLNDNDQPIVFRDEDDKLHMYQYRCALLNIAGYYHEVPASPKERRTARFAIQTSFEDARTKLKEFMNA